ncbi:hypothetical protein GCM10027280_01380 [Micromonospora polyrhachis]
MMMPWSPARCSIPRQVRRVQPVITGLTNITANRRQIPSLRRATTPPRHAFDLAGQCAGNAGTYPGSVADAADVRSEIMPVRPGYGQRAPYLVRLAGPPTGRLAGPSTGRLGIAS